MSISVEEAQKTIVGWVTGGGTICENMKHDTGDAGLKKDTNRLFLRPAINKELKSDLRWLKEIAELVHSPQQYKTRVLDYILYRRLEYARCPAGSEINPYKPYPNLTPHYPYPDWGPAYWPFAPILCLECAQSLGLVEIEGWAVVTYPRIICAKCGDYWDPADDLIPGAVLTLEPPDRWCMACCLREVPVIKDELMRRRIERAGDAASEAKDTTVANASSRRDKRELWRKEIDEALDDFMTDYAVCSHCGEEDAHLLEAVPGPNSPAGTVSMWRRDNSPALFKKKLQTTVVVCKACIAIGGN